MSLDEEVSEVKECIIFDLDGKPYTPHEFEELIRKNNLDLVDTRKKSNNFFGRIMDVADKVIYPLVLAAPFVTMFTAGSKGYHDAKGIPMHPEFLNDACLYALPVYNTISGAIFCRSLTSFETSIVSKHTLNENTKTGAKLGLIAGGILTAASYGIGYWIGKVN